MRGGFIHVPYLPEQVTELPEGTPSMSAELISQALETAIEAAINTVQDDDVAMGTIM